MGSLGSTRSLSLSSSARHRGVRAAMHTVCSSSYDSFRFVLSSLVPLLCFLTFLPTAHLLPSTRETLMLTVDAYIYTYTHTYTYTY